MKSQRKGGFLLAKIHQLAGRIFSAKLRAYGIGLNPSQGRIMFVLWRGECGMPIGALAERTSLSKSTLTSTLDRLESAGHVRRVRSADDRRIILIEPTKTNCAEQQLYVKVSQEMTSLFYAGFSGEEIDRLERYLDRILGNLLKVENPEDEEIYHDSRDGDDRQPSCGPLFDGWGTHKTDSPDGSD